MSQNVANLLLETDGKKVYLWVNSSLVKEKSAKNTIIIGRPLEEALTVKATLVQMGFRVDLEVVDNENERSWDLELCEWVDVPWKNLNKNPRKRSE